MCNAASVHKCGAGQREGLAGGVWLRGIGDLYCTPLSRGSISCAVSSTVLVSLVGDRGRELV